jgi:hypothetical protein
MFPTPILQLYHKVLLAILVVRVYRSVASRHHFRTNNALRRFDIATGKGSVVLTEESDVWVNLYPDNMFSELTAHGKDGSADEVH